MSVIPVKTGIHLCHAWIPASAGMTENVGLASNTEVTGNTGLTGNG